MARVLAALPQRTRQSRYDWGRWADGQIWELTAGTDFQSTERQLRTACYLHAFRKGMKATVRKIGPGVLAIQFAARTAPLSPTPSTPGDPS